MTQQIVVFAIVALAFGYASWKLMPRAWRTRLAQSAVRWMQGRGLSQAGATALERRLSTSGCGECDSCGTCGTAAGPASASDVSVVRFASDRAKAGP
jgi:hypothetical protein